jgi:hypothetical protein
MSSSQTSPNSNGGPIAYEAVGYASIEFAADNEGVSVHANSDGFRSLANLLLKFADSEGQFDHAYLLPTLQLTPSSLMVYLARRSHGPLPDGSAAPQVEEHNPDGSDCSGLG